MGKNHSYRKAINRLLLGLCFLFISQQETFAQYNLYYSVQNGGSSSSFTGSYSKTTDHYEHGTMTATPTGPIIANITPTPFAIDINSSKTWTGTIKVDPATAPAAGSMATASLKGHFDIFYSCLVPCSFGTAVGAPWWVYTSNTASSTDSVQHQMYELTGDSIYNFNVYSLLLKISGKKLVCKGDTVIYTTTTYPSGGAIKWSDGKTSSSDTLVLTKTTTLTATYIIQGISYSDTITTNVSSPGNWVTTLDLPKIPGWDKTLKTINEIKVKTKNVLYAVPAKIEIRGPEVTFSAKERDCCKDGIIIKNGEAEVGITATGSIGATDVPLASPPWTAAIDIYKQRYGYTFEISLKYGLFLTAKAGITGNLKYRINQCIPEDCLGGSIGLNTNISFQIKASGNACIVSANRTARRCKGITQTGARCGRRTTNLCGYCSNYNGPGVPLHTSQSWWCFSCPSFDITPAKIASSLYAKVGYNDRNCTEGYTARVGIGAVVFSTSVGILGYNLSWSYTIWSGADIYSYP